MTFLPFFLKSVHSLAFLGTKVYDYLNVENFMITDPKQTELETLPKPGVSRRDIIVGVTTAALAAALPSAFAATSKSQPEPTPLESFAIGTEGGVRRYMAASAMLPGGRLLLTGGFDQKWTDDTTPRAKNSAVIFDPYSGEWTAAAPMNSARARHAAVALADGRVVVIGGMGTHALASVEIYNPSTNTWHFAESLNQPRYDHSATTDGRTIFVIGGSGLSMITSVEAIQLPSISQARP